MKCKKINIILILISFAFTQAAYAQGRTKVQISSGRSFSNFDPGIASAGSDISSSVSSGSGVVSLSITSRGNYSISVQREDSNWNGQIGFYIRRTGNGFSDGTRGNRIQGGTGFIGLGNYAQTLFSGRYTRYSIPVEYEFRNLSVLIPSGGYTSSVIYTITSE